jgi:hypothetical protein
MAVTNYFMKTIFTMDEHVGQTYLKSGNGLVNKWFKRSNLVR